MRPALVRLVVGIAAVVGCARSQGGVPSATVSSPSTALMPELYGAGLFSTGAWDFFLAWSPDGRRVLFCRADTTFSTFEILETRRDDRGRWAPPRRPAFAEVGSNADPHVAPDGRTVYFISNRPLPGEERLRRTYDIWVARLGPDGEWGTAEHLPGPVNVVGVTEWSPAVAANGNLYFGTVRAGGHGSTDLWLSRWRDGAYAAPENLGDSINSEGAEIEPWVAPDERYLIFSAAGRPDSIGGYDLYVSERGATSTWGHARLVGAGVNSTALDFNPSVSPDGRWLYFSSNRPYAGALGPRFDRPEDERNLTGIGNGKWGDIYRVPLAAALGASPARVP